MKLTNYIRDAYIERALKDVPEGKDFENAITDAVRAVFAARLPAAVAKVWKDSSMRGHINTVSFHGLGVSLAVPGASERRYLDERHLTADERKPLETLKAEWDADKQMRDNLRNKLRAAAYGCTTRKALAELLPEFAHYLPPEEAPTGRSLPVVTNMVADFVKAGWPKDKKRPANGVAHG